MKLFETICVGMLLLPAASLWSQVDSTSTQPVPAYGVDAVPEIAITTIACRLRLP